MTGTTIDGASNSFSASALVQEFSDDALKMLKQAGVSEIDATLVLGELSELAQTLVGKAPALLRQPPRERLRWKRRARISVPTNWP